MRPGRYAAEDGSFARSTGTAVGRGVALLAVAVGLGVILLQTADDGTTTVSAGRTTTTQRASGTTTTLLPTTAPSTTVAARAPSSVKVLTANGTSTQGAGSRIKDRLLAAQYNALAATDAKAKVAASVVYFTPGYDPEAAVIAQLLALAPTAVQPMPAAAPVADLKGANVLVVVGPELAAQSAPATTATTAKPTATTAKPTSTTAKPGSTTTTAKPASTTSTTRATTSTTR